MRNFLLLVFSHFRLLLHILFLVNILVISTGWYLKVKLVNFTFVIFLNLYLQLFRPSYSFNLTDPYCRLMENEYKSLHDPHLREYYKRKDILRTLKKDGYITSDNKVGRRLLLFNHWRLLRLDIRLFLYLCDGGGVLPLTWSWEILNGTFHKLLNIWVNRNWTIVSKGYYFLHLFSL